MSMRTWKRGGTLLAALVLALGLLGCGSSTPSGVQQPSPEQQIPPPAVEESEPEPEPEAEKPTGLVIVKEKYLLKQKTYDVYCWNLDTHEETLIASFQVPYQTSSSDVYSASAVGVTVTRASFSDDFSKLAGQKIFAANGERHAGWHNTDGSYTDVTEALGQQSKSDFDPPVYYNSRGFAGGNFGYIDISGNAPINARDFYLPEDDLSSGAVQEGNVLEAGHPYDESGHLLSSKYGGEYLASEVTAWIDDTHAIVNLRQTSSYASLIVDTTAQTVSAYIPGDSRYGWNGVLSPDGTKIAFTSEPKNGTDIHTDIYIIPTGGGDPVKVEGLPYDLQGKSWQTKDGTCTLLDWI